MDALAAALAAVAPAAAPRAALLLGGGRGARRRGFSLGAQQPRDPPVTLWVLAPQDALAPLLVRCFAARESAPHASSH
jgi:hypothetical protein